MFENIETLAKKKRINLRPFKESDQTQLTEIANNYKIAKWLGDSFPHPYRQRHASSWIKNNNDKQSWHRAITYRENLVGSIGIQNSETDYPNFGFWIAEKAWGKNIATIAGKLYLTRFENRLNQFEGLQSYTFKGNSRSQHLLEDKFGFQSREKAVKKVRGVDRQIQKYYLSVPEKW